jgi:hypothetical protein
MVHQAELFSVAALITEDIGTREFPNYRKRW